MEEFVERLEGSCIPQSVSGALTEAITDNSVYAFCTRYVLFMGISWLLGTVTYKSTYRWSSDVYQSVNSHYRHATYNTAVL